MSKPYILHMITPTKHVSPFDANMAVDAGFEVLVPYTEVELREVSGLTQDAMFSRPPDYAQHTGLFIGGRDAALALDMLASARNAMFPPFQLSVFADPSGAFTTAAAMVAVVEHHLRDAGLPGLDGLRAHVYGATGVVGGIVGVIAAQAGAKATLISYRGLEPVQEKAADAKARFGVDLECANAPGDEEKRELMPQADVLLACGRAGVQIISNELLQLATDLKAAADINAVPPSGIEGVEVQAAGSPLGGGATKAIGALAVGDVKFRVQHQLLQDMRGGGGPFYFDFTDAFRMAREIASH